MGIRLISLADPDVSIKLNWWSWRPIEGIVRRAGSCTDEQLAELSYNSGAEFDAAVARSIARHVNAVLKAPDGDLLELDGTWSSRVDDGTFHRDDKTAHLNYGVPRATLEAVIAFCETCGGFRVV